MVLPMLTRCLFVSMSVFQRIGFSGRSCNDSVMMARSSAYRSGQGHPVRNSWERTSRTVMNDRGLRQEHRWTPTFTLNASLRLQPTHTLLRALSFPLCMNRNELNATLRRAYLMARLGTQLNSLSRSTKAIYSVLLTVWNLSCNWRAMSMVSGAAFRHEAKLHAIDANFVRAVGSSQLPFLSTWCPGLVGWGLYNLLARGRCPYFFRRNDTLILFIRDLEIFPKYISSTRSRICWCP